MARVQIKEPIDDKNHTEESSVAAKIPPTKNFLQVFLAKKQNLILIVIGLVILGVIVSLQRDKTKLAEKLNQTSAVQSAQTDDEAARLKQEIGKTLALPDETPVVTSIPDVTKFKNQAFFKNAQNGDQLLLFAKAGRVVLYRPSEQKVIEFTSFTTGNAPTVQTNR